MPRIIPNLWFDTESKEAAEFYTSIFPNSQINTITHYWEGGPRPAGTVLTVDFTLDGQPFTALDGGPEFTFNEALSLIVDCKDQEEIDFYWSRLTEGGEEGPCGWLKDRFGVSWQIVPNAVFTDLLTGADKERERRAMQAMMGMKKLDIAALYAAADGVPAAG